MKQVAIVVVVLGLASFALARPQTTQNPPAAQAGAQQGTTPSAAAPKRPPQAKTQPEFDAYQAAMASANDPAALEKAADDFASKYPQSELRVLLFRADMHAYQSANNGEKMMDLGHKVLAIDPDDPEALIGVSEVLVERTHDTDLDKQQRWDEAEKMAQHAIDTIDTDLIIPPNTPQEKVDAYKGFLKSSVYSILGTLQFNREKFPEAESYFHKSIDAYPSQPDPVVVLRLALALDKENRYVDALKAANQAVDLTAQNPAVGQAARRERDRLVQLTGGIPESSPPPAQAPPAAPKP